MTSSLSLLTPLAPTPDTTNPLSTDCNIVLPPFGVLTTHPGPPISISSTGSTLECDAYDVSSSLTNHTRALAAQWTGAPIRATVPLPRRTRVLNGNYNAPATSASAHAHTTGATTLRRSRRRARLAHLDSMDSDADNEGRDAEAEQGSDEEVHRGVASGSRRCFSYESITAAEGLSAWSFEELRVECYAQSLVARGSKPPPVVQPSLAIPPAFVPRIIPRNS